jgi:hypothetical protein
LHWLTENELQAKEAFYDEVAFGGWFVDLHTPGGLLAATSEPASAEGYLPDSEYAAKSFVGPYGIPLRSLIARDISNLFLAGRDISCTRSALGTVRVMGTTALMGQAIGTAAARARQQSTDAHGSIKYIQDIQQQLLHDGCFLPNTAENNLSNLSKKATISASSYATLKGCTTLDTWVSNGQLWGKPPIERSAPLSKAYGQFFFLASQLDQIAILVDASEQTEITLQLRKADSIWDYRRTLPLIAETRLPVAQGEDLRLAWDCQLSQLTAGCYRLDMLPNPAVAWRSCDGMVPGCYAVFSISPQKMRRMGNGQSLAFELMPAQPIWQPTQITSGVTRPHQQSNCWRSDPQQALPQHLELTWTTQQTINEIQITFAGHLLREVHAEPPFFRDAQCVKDYTVQSYHEGTWHDVLQVAGNYHQRRRHRLETPLVTQHLRIRIDATNGDASAVVYDINTK